MIGLVPALRWRSNAAVAAGLLCLVVGVPLAALPGSAQASPAWSIVTSPNGGTKSNLLPGVSCLSDSDCVAVGDYAEPRPRPPDSRRILERRHLVDRPESQRRDQEQRTQRCVVRLAHLV